VTRFLLVILALLGPAGCQQSSETSPAPLKPLVIATFYPLYEFARQVGGDRADVVALVPAGVEPHDWEPAPADVARVQRARVLVFNGAGLEPWIDKLRAEILPKDAVVVRATDGLPLVAADLPNHEHVGRDAHGHRHAHGQAAGARPGGGAAAPARDTPAGGGAPDPHVWLDPVLAASQVALIHGALAAADAANAATYEANARTYTAALAALHERFDKGLSDCARRDFVVSHAAFGYLARRYGLTQVPVMGLAPEAEPNPAELARIVRFMRRQKVTHVFFETLVSSRLAETLAREVGARTLVLNPVEGLTAEEAAAGRTYVTLMDANLANLRTALGCR
jgi:zinc transport system substrate-binding protein